MFPSILGAGQTLSNAGHRLGRVRHRLGIGFWDARAGAHSGVNRCGGSITRGVTREDDPFGIELRFAEVLEWEL